MSVITEAELLAATGLTRRTALARHLRAARIPFRTVAGKIITTSEAVTVAITGKKHNDNGPKFAEITSPGTPEPRPVLLRLAARRPRRVGAADPD